MRKDLKTGILFGVVLAIGVLIIMSVWPGASVEFRLKQSRTVVGEEPAAEAARSGEDPIGSAPDEPETVAERMVPVEQLDEGATVQVDEMPRRQVESPMVEEKRKMEIHVVASGETLSSISVIYYGSGSQWRRIVDANPKVITDENRLQPGMRLVIPK